MCLLGNVYKYVRLWQLKKLRYDGNEEVKHKKEPYRSRKEVKDKSRMVKK
jgi:hypothetical protein